ncbi:hypothetical protein GGC64_006370 [Mycobacterium sp. OAS707]|nr:hypothetical protein [Mycobacterium sp. OAS707]
MIEFAAAFGAGLVTSADGLGAMGRSLVSSLGSTAATFPLQRSSNIFAVWRETSLG